VRPDALVPPQVVGLGSTAACWESDGLNCRVQSVQVVAPEDADPICGRVSVLSDLGAALIGLAPGQSILWRDRVGGLRQVMVLEEDGRGPAETR
jgi:regulator of nucleoside diphosphate kinase